MEKNKNDKMMYFIYSADGKQYVNTCIGLKELSYFLNRQEWRVKKDLLLARRKRKTENKLIMDKNKNQYVIISEKELDIGR